MDNELDKIMNNFSYAETRNEAAFELREYLIQKRGYGYTAASNFVSAAYQALNAGNLEELKLHIDAASDYISEVEGGPQLSFEY